MDNPLYYMYIHKFYLFRIRAARRSNLFTLKEISPEYSLKGQMLKLKLQYFGVQPDVKDWIIWKNPDAGKD